MARRLAPLNRDSKGSDIVPPQTESSVQQQRNNIPSPSVGIGEYQS